MQSALKVKNDQHDPITEFFDDGRRNDRPEARGISRDDQKGNLPGQAGADESVIKSRMSNRWWILAADEIEHEIKRSEDQKSPDGSDPEYSLGKFHC